MPELQVIARYTVQPGNEDEVAALLRRLGEAMAHEPGNLAFSAYRALDGPREVVLLGRYASRAAFAAHLETRHFADLLRDGIWPLLASRTVETYDVT